MSKKTKKVEQSKSKTAYMYLGPSVQGGLLFSNTVYKEIPIHIKEYIKKIPELERLFVEIKEVPNFKNALKNQSTEEFRIHKIVKEKLKEVK